MVITGFPLADVEGLMPTTQAIDAVVTEFPEVLLGIFIADLLLTVPRALRVAASKDVLHGTHASFGKFTRHREESTRYVIGGENVERTSEGSLFARNPFVNVQEIAYLLPLTRGSL
jgi:hypothetical protein